MIRICSPLSALAVGLVVLWVPQALDAEATSASAHAASCRDSRLPPLSRQPWEEGPHLRLDVDVNGDGLPDLLEVTRSLGSGFSSTEVQLTLGGSGVQLEAEEGVDFTAISAVSPVPKKLLDPRHRGALEWIEDALFGRVCTIPDPSLAWLLDPAKRLTWIAGPPEMPDHYAIRLPVSRVPRAIKESYAPVEELDVSGEAWLSYAGGVHGYPPAEQGPVELASQGDRVLLGTAHGVILTNRNRSRHAWIYVHGGNLGVKLRFPSIASARLDGDTATIRLTGFRLPDNSSAEPQGPESLRVRVNLRTGAIAK
jgi:hypothetical protein